MTRKGGVHDRKREQVHGARHATSIRIGRKTHATVSRAGWVGLHGDRKGLAEDAATARFQGAKGRAGRVRSVFSDPIRRNMHDRFWM